MYNIRKVSSYICDKFYAVTYSEDGLVKKVFGLMLNYASGNIVLLAESGVYHIRYSDILFMKPIVDIPIEKLDKEYVDVISVFEDEN